KTGYLPVACFLFIRHVMFVAPGLCFSACTTPLSSTAKHLNLFSTALRTVFTIKLQGYRWMIHSITSYYPISLGTNLNLISHCYICIYHQVNTQNIVSTIQTPHMSIMNTFDLVKCKQLFLHTVPVKIWRGSLQEHIQNIS